MRLGGRLHTERFLHLLLRQKFQQPVRNNAVIQVYTPALVLRGEKKSMVGEGTGVAREWDKKTLSSIELDDDLQHLTKRWSQK